MKRIPINETFVNTRNIRNFQVMMDGLALGEGRGRFGVVHGQAGLGKTTAVDNWYGNNKSHYIRFAKVWSPTDFLFALARELKVVDPIRRRGALFSEVVDKLLADPVPLFVDEIDKMGAEFLEILRDLADMTGAAVVLVGEESLVRKVQMNRRVWSRVYQQLAFGPIAVDDVARLFIEAAGLKMAPAVAKYVHERTQGNWRDVYRYMLVAAQYCQHNDAGEITDDLAKIVDREMLRSRGAGGDR
jgi:hypothetical protein